MNIFYFLIPIGILIIIWVIKVQKDANKQKKENLKKIDQLLNPPDNELHLSPNERLKQYYESDKWLHS